MTKLYHKTRNEGEYGSYIVQRNLNPSSKEEREAPFYLWNKESRTYLERGGEPVLFVSLQEALQEAEYLEREEGEKEL